MFVLRTGLQGHSKTLNTIKELDEKAAREGRKVYYCNITKFKPDHPAIKAEWVEFDTPEKWFELPANAMIVIDEAQTWFRTRPQGSKVPEYASRLEIMRKDGHELHCITQSPKLIDAHMRELCNSHIHYYRGGKGQVVKRWEFEKPELGVNGNKLEFENGQSSRMLIDKTYFGCYESVKEGTGHHFKFKAPKAMYVLIGCAVLLALGVGKIWWSRYAKHDEPVVEVAKPAEVKQGSPLGAGPAPEQHASKAQYIADRLPRIPDVPSSAPIYDEITKPVAYPKPFCVSSRDDYFIQKNAKRMVTGYREGKLYGCRCNSQQGSRLDISFEACMAYVEYGVFDPAIPDRSAATAAGRDASAASTAAGVASSQAQPVVNAASTYASVPVTVVPDSEYSSRPWR
ncbi:zonular occludens toxin domain-containing protein [Pseudomonas nitroreducens]|uniref:Zonular occludens toxin n=1 Tax=Pseudomonas nitroreducens TaxID=46680 RepID=A0A6G6J718_PSENT|nr:zonular occludens toxin domain-containing protein [Pseudomonas nitroreducens]QIE91148.1 zonular occludens toxin [Pseudomonas nitroreducens]QIE91159.1 zonular occludens toxin [Pseudomonas nitroreducens]